ncbi:DUF2190 family protein [Sphingomonas yantingensis]|uniref:Putative RecA/RadA family phage recombinase n=1 Tax=Sphingomonas yantingensis TaxID=1241761 RepID=A0A7W9ASX7_9SPHN|nr:DUF2190 family protein [Sphingomonas yantingensis]MBB5700008.1 putative RecA/RadA family phage recombinase [Sphingomonas yantingensis]
MNNKRHDEAKRIGATRHAGLIGGNPYKFGAVFGVAIATVAAGERGVIEREGGYFLKVEAVGEPVTAGSAIYFEAGRADAELHNDETDAGGILVGFAALDLEADVPVGQVREIEVFIDKRLHVAA